MKTRNYKGQYQHTLNRKEISFIVIFIVLLGVIIYSWAYHPMISPIPPETWNKEVMAAESYRTATISATATPTIKVSTPSATPTITEHDQIANYIKEVFGADSQKAFKLLSCENGKLNPKAVNNNKDKDGNITSSDYGLFQVNEFWQKTQKKFLLNYRINTQIAYQLFIENNKQFNLWTCGRKLGI